VIRFLLDVNVLISLVDPAHVRHDQVHGWFGRTGRKAFATCPITENGLLRIVGHPKYPNSPGPPNVVARALAAIRALPGHAFWPDSISLLSSDGAKDRANGGANDEVYAALLSNHARVTDTYLLALARENKGQLATLDQKLATDAATLGSSALLLI
jgi:uncharacterized protein